MGCCGCTIPESRPIGMKKALWFFYCGKDRKKQKEERNQTAKDFRKNKVLYSFEKDADLIYAAFLSEYGIDLQDIEDMHWWKFSALFDGLADDQKIRQVMHIRGMNTSGLPRKEVKRINELKKLYALDDEISVDGRVALAKRNAEMKEYVRRRMEEVKRRVGT